MSAIVRPEEIKDAIYTATHACAIDCNEWFDKYKEQWIGWLNRFLVNAYKENRAFRVNLYSLYGWMDGESTVPEETVYAFAVKALRNAGWFVSEYCRCDYFEHIVYVSEVEELIRKVDSSWWNKVRRVFE